MGVILRANKYHGTAELGLSRYLVLYTAQLGWILLGVFFLKNAYWPSSCQPRTIVEIYICSQHLPGSRHVIETALATWLWSTPLLILLDVSRRYRAWMEKRQR
jgi:hypothetical protein